MRRCFIELYVKIIALMRATLPAAGCSLIVQDFSLSYDCTTEQVQAIRRQAAMYCGKGIMPPTSTMQ
jgi:hypothetical protein